MIEFSSWLIVRFVLTAIYYCNGVEFLLVGLAIFLAKRRSGTPASLLSRIERIGSRISRRPWLAFVSIPLAAVLLRLASLPLAGIPAPYVPDEFGHLLLAATFLDGRLTNPTHPLWTHFETIHVFHTPTYSSMYLAGQALVLALGKLLFGHPWWGVLLSSAAMAFSLYWMLKGWFSPGWSYFGAVIAVLRLCVSSYWVNSYWGGCVAATGGALLCGAYPRLLRKLSAGDGLVLGGGLALILLTRPVEGSIVASIVVGSLGVALWRRGASRAFLRGPAVSCLILPALALSFTLLHNRAVTGNAFTLPYMHNQSIYGWPLTLPWFHSANIAYRHRELKQYFEWELQEHRNISGLPAIVADEGLKLPRLWQFFVGPSLTVLLLFLGRAARDRRIRVAFVAAAVTTAAVILEQSSYPHYLAASTGAILIVLVQCMRHLRASRRRDEGTRYLMLLPCILVVMLAVRAAAPTQPPDPATAAPAMSWCCNMAPGARRDQIARQLEQTPGEHVVFVRYSHNAYNTNEWVYNAPDIDRSKVVWARDMGPAANREVLAYYPHRQAWVVEADRTPTKLSRYSAAGEK